VGYAGGQKDNPTYYNLGGNAETVQIDYDPARVTYGDLLEVFWSSHNSTYPSSGQYRSAIFYHSEEQKKLALESKEREQVKHGREIFTQIEPFRRFTLAEDYHQKYYLRGMPRIVDEYKRIYPDLIDFVNSTAVARVNGYAGNNGGCDSLKRDLPSLGLSQSAREKLANLICGDEEIDTGAACPSGVVE